jgi:hypothetical protein
MCCDARGSKLRKSVARPKEWISEEEIFHFRAMNWLFYFSHLGFEVGRLYLEDSSQLDRTSTFPTGVRYLCCFGLDESHPKSDPENTHAVAIDEAGIVFDPATDAPGTHPLIHYRTWPREDIAYRIC